MSIIYTYHPGTHVAGDTVNLTAAFDYAAVEANVQWRVFANGVWSGWTTIPTGSLVAGGTHGHRVIVTNVQHILGARAYEFQDTSFSPALTSTSPTYYLADYPSQYGIVYSTDSVNVYFNTISPLTITTGSPGCNFYINWSVDFVGGPSYDDEPVLVIFDGVKRTVADTVTFFSGNGDTFSYAAASPPSPVDVVVMVFSSSGTHTIQMYDQRANAFAPDVLYGPITFTVV